MANDSLETMIARLEGKIDALSAKVDGQINEIRAAITAGDRQNETAITYVRADVARIEGELTAHRSAVDARFDESDERIDRNRRLVWTTVVAPVLVAVVVAILLYNFGLGR